LPPLLFTISKNQKGGQTLNKIIKIIAVTGIFAALSAPVSAYNYTFSSGADSKMVFGKPTDSDVFAVYNPYENVRNNKDSAYSPPPYGVFSGEIPTELVSVYHSQDKPSAANSTQSVNYSGSLPNGESAATPILPEVSQSDEILPSTSVYTESSNILPLYYGDGSVGTLEFPQFDRQITVYEGETPENMILGAGHASSTSAWDGNCAIFAHNRGVPNNFIFLKNMKTGDKIIYKTLYGVRTYEVISKTQIAETDTSPLAWSENNTLSLVTCVENVPEKRWYIYAKLIN
jgi:LPXTG-site transpeptidase (sortase) family protein